MQSDFVMTSVIPPVQSKAALDSLDQLEQWTHLLDSQFRIPGTNIRFGLDPLIGLIPGVGDLASFLVSAWMVAVMSKHGIRAQVIVMMMANVVVDLVIGSVPVLGIFVDVSLKANRRNLRLLRKHYQEGKYQARLGTVLLVFVLTIGAVVGLFIWGLVALVQAIF